MSKNKLLQKHNELIMQQTIASNQAGTNPSVNTQTENTATQTMNGVLQEDGIINDEAKTYNSVPTHTSIPKEILEKQQSEIDALAASSKVEAPTNTIKEDDTRAQENSVEAKA